MKDAAGVNSIGCWWLDAAALSHGSSQSFESTQIRSVVARAEVHPGVSWPVVVLMEAQVSRARAGGPDHGSATLA